MRATEFLMAWISIEIIFLALDLIATQFSDPLTIDFFVIQSGIRV